MAIDLKCIEIKRGKDGSIFSAFLSDGNKTLEVSKEEIKIKLLKGYWKIDKLYLTSDNRLLERVKDTLISDYEESCKTLGIEPFKIIKVDNDYIIVDFPKNKNNLVVPDFVTRVYIDKRIGNSSNNVEVNQNKNLVSTFYSSSKEESFRKIDEIHLLLKSIYNGKVDLNQNIKSDIKKLENLLNEYLNKNISSEEEIKDKLDDVESLIQEFKDSELESDKELLKYLNEAKFVLQDTGVKVLELKSSLTPLFSNMTLKYSNSIVNLPINDKKDNLITSLPRQIGFVTKDEYICKEKDTYNNYFIKNRELLPVFPYDKLSILYDYYFYYEKIYDNLYLMFKDLKDEEVGSIVEFNQMVSPFLHFLETLDSTNFFDGFFEKNKTSKPKLRGNLSKLFSSAVNFSTDLVKRGRSVELSKQLSNVYSEPEELQKFLDTTDRDIAIYLAEYNYLRLYNNIDNLRFSNVFNLFDYLHKRESQITLSEEEKKRVALSFIICEKIMDRQDGLDIGIQMIPYYNSDSVDLNKCVNNSLAYNHINNYINLYFSVFMSLWFTFLIMLGFRPKYAKLKIIDTLLDIYNMEIYDLDNKDIQNMTFVLKDYE